MGLLKVIGIITGSLAIVSVVIILILSFALPAGFWMGAKSAEKEYDNWLENAKEGDEITVSGKIADKESGSLVGISFYTYRFKGCENGFTSSGDIGDVGDSVLVTIEFTIAPEATSSPRSFVVWGPNICCGILSGLLLIIGLILFLIGLIKKKKVKNDTVNPPVNPTNTAESVNIPPVSPPIETQPPVQKRVIPPPAFLQQMASNQPVQVQQPIIAQQQTHPIAPQPVTPSVIIPTSSQQAAPPLPLSTSSSNVGFSVPPPANKNP